MFIPRDNEQDYAKLDDVDTQAQNRYGKMIDLIAGTDLPRNQSLNINGDPGVGENPNRNKQHGFHFTADNCIGCHACEAACSEKNNLPPHLAFRSVGYLEGGSWPDYKRMNISMACNHCDNPVCLKGCPTRAYTKHPEYGAVIQDPNICFGCGYCTWVCPYNAPQLDPMAGHVQKCNMCVDRLEVGLKPACVSACLGKALNFGVIENTPEGRTQTDIQIPGFPDPSITNPNIRFEQTKSLPRDFTRPDSQPIKYHRNDDAQTYSPETDNSKSLSLQGKSWGLSKLSSRENPLVIFTLATQAVIGAFAILFLGTLAGLEPLQTFSKSWGYIGVLTVLLGMQAFALFLSTLHLGRPWRFYRGFNNLRYSPLSREALSVAMFFGFAGGHWLTSLVGQSDATGELAGTAKLLGTISGVLAIVAGAAGIYFMTQIYCIKSRPFWNHWQVSASFFGTALSLGAVVVALGIMVSAFVFVGVETTDLNILLTALVLGLGLEGLGLAFHARDLKHQGGEGAAAHHVQTTEFAGSYLLRNVLIGTNMATAMALATLINFGMVDTTYATLIGLALTATTLVTAAIGRALFYVLVIPTTMPGAFFWKNKGFEEHARETGLAEMPQCGVAVKTH
ncbi:MAG: dimethyl sulfoxide reductase anchor subunit [Magnetovibrio sp.]|nr:dimethyl sulfoxide reductase anchor subunit [Magnetovibrio sp.]